MSAQRLVLPTLTGRAQREPGRRAYSSEFLLKINKSSILKRKLRSETGVPGNVPEARRGARAYYTPKLTRTRASGKNGAKRNVSARVRVAEHRSEPASEGAERQYFSCATCRRPERPALPSVSMVCTAYREKVIPARAAEPSGEETGHAKAGGREEQNPVLNVCSIRGKEGLI